MSEQALAKAEKAGAIAGETQQDEGASLAQIIMRAARDPQIDVEKMERLLAMHERITEQQRRSAFASALSELQAELPQIRKDGRIVVGGTERSRYARLEDIDRAIRPLLAKHGFAFSFDSKAIDAKTFLLSCKLSHSEGHFEVKDLPLPLDKGATNREGRAIRSDVQDVGSTISYGRRQLIKMHLNLIERDEDTDGINPTKLSIEQAAQIYAAFAETITRDGKPFKINQAKFLQHMGVDKVENILSRDFGKAKNAIETWRRG